MRVINLYGGPGTGKSTTRANLFGLMKGKSLLVDEAPEFAKDLTYEENWSLLANQGFVTAGQEQRQARLNGKVDWCVSDCPLPLAIYYARGTRYDTEWYRNFVWGLFDSYSNINIFLERVKPYQKYGRTQSEDEAKEIDRYLLNLMKGRIHFYVRADEEAHKNIFEHLMVLDCQSS
jgi:hypothetical protein